jgi:hypothetical protein
MAIPTFSSLKAGLISGVVVGAALLLASPLQSAYAANVNFNSARDCDANAIMHCGAMNADELQDKYGKDDSITVIYDYFGISNSDVDAIGSRAVAGAVKKNGEVVVNGKTVAKDALTAGRHNINGSTKVTVGGVTFYTRTPSVSFRPEQIDAFVVLKDNGQFDYAILAACGNPVKATNTVPAPVKPTEPTPAPAPVKPTPVTPVTPVTPPAPTPAPAPAPAPAPVTLPETGPASVAAVFLATTLAGTALYSRYLKRRLA